MADMDQLRHGGAWLGLLNR